MPGTDEKVQLKKDLDFQKTYLEGLFLLFKEASGQGLLSEYEDLVDTLYSIFPSKHKRSIQIYDEKLESLSPVYVEWGKALKMGPPPGSDEMQKKRKLRVEVRERCLRKAQIVTDIAQELKLIGEEFPDVEMGEESEVFKRVSAFAGQVR